MDKNSLHQQETDFEIINALLPYLNHKTFIDIGAEKGAFAKPLIDQGLTGVLFEPLPKHENELRQLVSNTESMFHTYAIDSSDHQASFHIACDDDGAPLDYFHSLQPLTNDNRIKHKKTLNVQCRSLNSLAQEGIINNHIGLVKTDTEGNDLHVLNGMGAIKAEVLVCEYFMPGIYDGWEQGHPQGLIAEAKKLGFNHFIAIKRMYEYEFISIDSHFFCEKQWGNLIFINDTIFERAKFALDAFINSREARLYQSITDYTTALQNEIAVLSKVCAERQNEITMLTNACNERLDLIKRINNEAVHNIRTRVLKHQLNNRLTMIKSKFKNSLNSLFRRNSQ